MLHALRRSWNLLSRRQKTALSLLAAARVLANGLDIVGIAMIGAVGALALSPTISVPLVDQLNIPRDNLLVFILLAAGLVFIIKTVFGLVLARTTLLYLAKVETIFSIRVANSIFSGSHSRIRQQSQPEIEWAILRSTQKAFTGFLGNAVGFVAEASLAILVFGFLFFTDWTLALAVTLYFSLILVFFQLYSRGRLSAAGEDFAQGSISVSDAIKNLTSAFKEISVLAKTPTFIKILAESRGKVARADATNLYFISVPRLIVELGLIVGAIGFVAFQYSRYEELTSLATFGVFIMGSLRMMSALLPLQRAFQFIKYETPGALAAQNLLWDLKNSGEVNTDGISLTAAARNQFSTADTHGGIGVVIDHVSFEYDDAAEPTVVLRDIAVRIEAGSTVAMIGPSGAGKSTLVDLVLGLHEPTTGEILCAGMSPVMLRALCPGSISYVPQKPGLVSGTIEQNIALGVPAEEIDEIALWEAINAAQLTDLVDALPQGVKSSLGKHSDSLSGGQLQRLGVARALYTRPRLLVLDEATSALDAETESAIAQSLALLKGHTTLIIVAHRLSTIQKADAIHVLDGGRIIASGTFQELRKGSPLVKKYVQLMSFDE
jgi:ATP-binding cassette subfamily C protein